ncbi:sugar phosphate isomerase/epimerase family protein [Pseudomonas sp. H11T01]|uniref:sugar phosphate isomerase/epimerase family protein n=1 Tax=Pseudomonas sp. H11T01 TaxID=3402749 RepID=UPI003AC240D4
MAPQKNMLTFNTTAAKHCNFIMQMDTARSAGFNSVELTSGPVRAYLEAGYSQRELKESLDGLHVQGIGALFDIERTGAQGREMMDQAEKLYELASTVGAKGVQLVTGPLDYRAVVEYRRDGRTSRYSGLLGCTDEEQIAQTAINLQRLAVRAQEAGLIVYVEALSWTPVSTLEQQVRTLDRADRDNLKIVIDYWHCYTSGANPDDLAKIDKRHIYGVHVCDSLPFTGGVPDETALRDVITGCGILDLKAWTQAVKATGYEGWWCSETFCRAQHQNNGYVVAKQLYSQLNALVNG